MFKNNNLINKKENNLINNNENNLINKNENNLLNENNLISNFFKNFFNNINNVKNILNNNNNNNNKIIKLKPLYNYDNLSNEKLENYITEKNIIKFPQKKKKKIIKNLKKNVNYLSNKILKNKKKNEWSKKEKKIFWEAYKKFGNNWTLISNDILKTRTRYQIASYYQNVKKNKKIK